MWQAARRYREEHDAEGSASILVERDASWWVWHPKWGAHTNVGDPGHLAGHGSFERLFDPAPLLGGAFLEAIGTGRRAGRPAIRLRALPRPEAPDAFFHGWGRIEEPFDLWIDAERGIALNDQVAEITAVQFDVDIPEELFASPFPPDVVVQSPFADEARDVTLDQARAALSFPLLMPTRLPAGTRLRTAVLPPGDEPRRVYLHYVVDPGARYDIAIEQAASGEDAIEDRSRWRSVELQGKQVLVREEEVGSERRIDVAFEQGGVSILLHSNLPRDEALRVAASLEKTP